MPAGPGCRFALSCLPVAVFRWEEGEARSPTRERLMGDRCARGRHGHVTRPTQRARPPSGSPAGWRSRPLAKRVLPGPRVDSERRAPGASSRRRRASLSRQTDGGAAALGSAMLGVNIGEFLGDAPEQSLGRTPVHTCRHILSRNSSNVIFCPSVWLGLCLRK